jgi:hypothetical protein
MRYHKSQLPATSYEAAWVEQRVAKRERELHKSAVFLEPNFMLQVSFNLFQLWWRKGIAKGVVLGVHSPTSMRGKTTLRGEATPAVRHAHFWANFYPLPPTNGYDPGNT